MSQTTTELKQEVQKTIALLTTLRDEVRVNLHLAGLDARDEWNKLEPHIIELEKAAEHATEATRTALADLVRRVKAFRAAQGGQRT